MSRYMQPTKASGQRRTWWLLGIGLALSLFLAAISIYASQRWLIYVALGVGGMTVGAVTALWSHARAPSAKISPSIRLGQSGIETTGGKTRN